MSYADGTNPDLTSSSEESLPSRPPKLSRSNGASVRGPLANYRGRAVVFTVNNYLDSDPRRLLDLVATAYCRYVCFGIEAAPTTGTPHLQGFAYFQDAKTFSAIQKILGKCHIEWAKDSADTGYACAIDYCTKGGDFHEAGVPPVSQVVKGKKY